jgi:hypothetical protein
MRFMLHPLKVSFQFILQRVASTGYTKLTISQSSSTFECDGCAHHASFHNLENKAEDEVRKRWEVEQKAKEAEAQLNNAAKSRKRLRLTEGPKTANNGRLLIQEHAFREIVEVDEGSDTEGTVTTRSNAPALRTKVAQRARKVPAVSLD